MYSMNLKMSRALRLAASPSPFSSRHSLLAAAAGSPSDMAANLEFVPSATGQPDLEAGVEYTSTQPEGAKGWGWLFQEEEEEEEELLPLLEELDVDVWDILYKIRCVLLPFRINREVLLSSPDFWGPMTVVLIYGFLLVWGQFEAMSWVFTVWLCGSFLVFILARALGGEVSYSQSVGVIGYSLLPLVLAVAALYVVSAFPKLQWGLQIAGTLWSTFSAGSLLGTVEMAHKRILLMYPILLLYIYFISLFSGV